MPPRREGGIQTGRAVVLLVVAVLVAVVLLNKLGTGKSTTSTAAGTATTTPTTVKGGGATTTTSTTVAPIPPGQVKLLVLNGTLSGNLAGTASKKLAASPGFTTLAPDNTTSKVLTSSVYAASPQYLPSAQAVAAVYGIPASAVTTPIPSSAPIAASEKALANVVLIIGPDIAGKVAAG
ncbi:LytR C-terminal domain-containing protein [Acidiferrimicrobium sp. IK]|uniref:LytR C-terminal domain-containing protein n=1 Tax=Acidiferrimicrobium sp. IK TaxID=2871700 RepID=UPI0021CB593D|nr:LytR C-terminal domain-containing protein [Acidiferrimicrobium sp. IK]MCU4186898.1 LytR C-terminal domain-containing protein [Acidiferrimicrobium sp. IK]